MGSIEHGSSGADGSTAGPYSIMPTFTSVEDYLDSLPPEQSGQHLSLYPVPPEGDLALDADLAPYAGAKGTLKLPYADLDYDLLERVLRRLLEQR